MDSDIIPSSKQKPSGPVPEPPKDQGPEPIDIEPVNFNVDEEPISQPSAPAPSATNFSSEKPKKKSNVVTLLLILIALCGVGFGVYGIMFAPGMNKKCESPKDLTVKIQSEDGSITTLETDKISTSSDGKTITIADTKAESSSKDYIYIGEWGLKIKKPEDITFNEYEYITKTTSVPDTDEFTTTITISYGQENAPSRIFLVSAPKTLVDNGEAQQTSDRAVYSDDSSYYFVMHATSNDSELTAEGKALFDAFNNPEIYSKF